MKNNQKVTSKGSKGNNSSKGVKAHVLPNEYFMMAGNDQNAYHGETALPYVDLQCKPVLDIIGLASRKTRRNGELVYEYWDKDCVEYEEKVLPLYFKLSNGEYKSATKVKGSVPTAKMAAAAKKQQEDVDQAAKYYKKYSYAKHIMAGNPCGVTVTRRIFKDSIDWNDDTITVFHYPIDSSQSIVVFFDKKKVDEIRAADTTHRNAELTLIVPKYMEQYFSKVIGKGGLRIQYMQKAMKVRCIKVLKESEVAAQ